MKLDQLVSSYIIRVTQKYGPHKVQVLGKSYVISKEVFNPKFYYTSEFMAKHIDVKPCDEVLDMGTGSGILAITAGQVARKVIAVDINPFAVRCARENVKRNKLENVVSVVQGDLFSPLPPKSRFDVILFTPPYMEEDQERPLIGLYTIIKSHWLRDFSGKQRNILNQMDTSRWFIHR